MVAALALLPLALIAAVYVWQSARTERRRMMIERDREREVNHQLAEAKRWQDAVDATASRMGALEATLGASLADIQTRLARVEQGREPFRRTG